MDFSKQKLLVIAPHPDDEVLGCAGLIHRVKSSGGKVYVLIMTVGDEKQYGGESNADMRVKEVASVMKFLQADG
jgi:N-acetylglucosamine malate deacetylase 1